MLASGTILSRLAYVAPLWSGASKRTLKKLNQFLNSTVRWVAGAKRGQRIKTADLYKQIGWLSLKQLVTYQGLKFLYKSVVLKKSEYFDFSVQSEAKFALSTNEKPRLVCVKNGTKHCLLQTFDKIPAQVWEAGIELTQMKRLREWVKLNVEDDIT